MAASALSFNPRYSTPSADVQRKLRLSMQEAERAPYREMKCLVCDFPVARIPITQTDVVYVKCHQCKFTGVLSSAYFRRMKRYRHYCDEFSQATRRRMNR